MKLLSLYRNSFLLLIFVMSSPHPGAMPSRPQRIGVFKRNWASDIADDAKRFWDDLKRVVPWASGTAFNKMLPDELKDIPLPERIQAAFGLDEQRTSGLPLRVFNFPSYGYWTDEGWNLRIRATVYKQPALSTEKLDDLLLRHLAHHSATGDFTPEERAQSRNATASLFVSQRYQKSPFFGVSRIREGSVETLSDEEEVVQHIQKSSTFGDLDAFVPLDLEDVTPGDSTTENQRVLVNAKDAEWGQAESLLVPPQGISVVTDLDDIIKETIIWHPIKGGIMNTWIHPDVPWSNMPSVLARWSQTFPDLHFHYVSLTPEQLGRTTLQFLQDYYPPGSLDLRPMSLEGWFKGRPPMLNRIFDTFPERKFILMGDASTAELLKVYTQAMKDRPEQIQCTLIRNVSATDPTFQKPYDTGLFEGIDPSKFMFFRTPDDLLDLNLLDGECNNLTFVQNLTMSVQNVPGLDDDTAEDIFEALPFLKWFVNMA